jgi:hypothetical protein
MRYRLSSLASEPFLRCKVVTNILHVLDMVGSVTPVPYRPSSRSQRRAVTSLNAVSIAEALYLGQRTIPMLRCDIGRSFPKIMFPMVAYSSRQSCTVIRNRQSIKAMRLRLVSRNFRDNLSTCIPSGTGATNHVEVVAW